MSAELIAKLEGASEGSRDLDTEVLAATGHRDRRFPMDSCPYVVHSSNPDRGLSLSEEVVTTSIDAALALAERLGRDPSEVLRSAWSEVVRKYALHQRPFDGASYTQAIALAICAALLRSRGGGT